MTSAKEKIEGSKDDFERDVQEIRETAKNKNYDLTRKVRHIAKKEKDKLVILGIILAYVLIVATDTINIPEWLYLMTFAALIAGIVSYPFAQKLVRMFIKDERIPLLELPDNGFDLYKIPRERLQDIEFTDGEIHETQTADNAQRAFELRKFERVVENGESRLIGKGTWEGTFTNGDIKRTWEYVKAMRQNLVSEAQRAKQYDTKMPFWIHQIENQTVNDIVYQFEKGINYKGADMHKQIQSDMGLDGELNLEGSESKNEENDQIEEMNEQLEEMKNAMNGVEN